MKTKYLFKISAIALSLLFGGCASYAPSLVKLNPSGPNVKKATNDYMALYIEEHTTSEKSEKAFDADLGNEGVLALLILVENNSQAPYEVKTSDLVLKGSKALKPLSPEQAATKAQRGAVARALGWSLIVPIISIPAAVAASAIHTNKVNQQIVNDFVAKGFQDGVIMPNKERSGFIFFQLEEGRKDLAGLTLEMTARNVTTGESTILATFLPEASFSSVKVANVDESPEAFRTPSND